MRIRDWSRIGFSTAVPTAARGHSREERNYQERIIAIHLAVVQNGRPDRLTLLSTRASLPTSVIPSLNA